MMQTFDPWCLDAFARLLARPDPTDLPRRTHVYRCEGDPDRRATRLPGILMAWLQRRHLEIDIQQPLAAAPRGLKSHERRTNPDRRVLHRRGISSEPATRGDDQRGGGTTSLQTL